MRLSVKPFQYTINGSPSAPMGHGRRVDLARRVDGRTNRGGAGYVRAMGNPEAAGAAEWVVRDQAEAVGADGVGDVEDVTAVVHGGESVRLAEKVQAVRNLQAEAVAVPECDQPEPVRADRDRRLLSDILRKVDDEDRS